MPTKTGGIGSRGSRHAQRWRLDSWSGAHFLWATIWDKQHIVSCRECPRQDSNLRTTLRRRVLYPLSYEGSGEENSISPRPANRRVEPLC